MTWRPTYSQQRRSKIQFLGTKTTDLSPMLVPSLAGLPQVRTIHIANPGSCFPRGWIRQQTAPFSIMSQGALRTPPPFFRLCREGLLLTNLRQRTLFCLSVRLTVSFSASLHICTFHLYVCFNMAEVKLQNCSPAMSLFTRQLLSYYLFIYSL